MRIALLATNISLERGTPEIIKSFSRAPIGYWLKFSGRYRYVMDSTKRSALNSRFHKFQDLESRPELILAPLYLVVMIRLDHPVGAGHFNSRPHGNCFCLKAHGSDSKGLN